MDAEYYDRVRPLLGEAFFQSEVCVWGLDFGYLAAEALARTGIKRQVWFDSGDASRALCRSLGWQHQGRPQAEALRDHCQAHNTLETDWSLDCLPMELAGLKRRFAADPPDLLLARGRDHSGEVARVALDHGVPMVMTFTPATSPVGCVHVVWVPGSAADPEAVISACEELAALPRRDLNQAAEHLEGIEARSIRDDSADHSTAVQRTCFQAGVAVARRKRPMPALGSSAGTSPSSSTRPGSSGSTTRATSIATRVGV